MKRARGEQGVAEWTMPGLTVTRPTVTCIHCNCVHVIPVGATPDECGGFCRLCMAPTCQACAAGPCTPFERQLEAMEAAGRLAKACGIE